MIKLLKVELSKILKSDADANFNIIVEKSADKIIFYIRNFFNINLIDVRAKIELEKK